MTKLDKARAALARRVIENKRLDPFVAAVGRETKGTPAHMAALNVARREMGLSQLNETEYATVFPATNCG